ncbi:MAG: 30S ribosomal protein S20 [Candidatus Komeilibacteria bacterium RIFCSPLOWO2_02_FULL_48_11]|uniref:Small ribosomal subunit protein bS20 n=1 Tax=Candidatus Komeilibacteria bacterium RIFCSPLOWO2_02_FULL_48_11 TaxID=1798553 RepID=A0A1G2BQM2_9BACT|nr:MAG: 30S ribosomal protein S20 [Candidatus Komeilibacteria bacterium RIFCSPLOWO2_02_FULL_48_11]
MPIKQSAVKELRKTKKRTARNRSAKSNIKDALKKVTKALQSKDIVAARAAAQEAVKILDKAAAKHIIHRNKAARKKSRVFAAIKKIEADKRG